MTRIEYTVETKAPWDPDYRVAYVCETKASAQSSAKAIRQTDARKPKASRRRVKVCKYEV